MLRENNDKTRANENTYIILYSYTGPSTALLRSVFFHAFLNDRDNRIYYRIFNSLYYQCGLFHVPSNDLVVYFCSHTGNSCMVYNLCEFFHASLNCLMLNICIHNGNSCTVFLLSDLIYASSKWLMLSTCNCTGCS